MEKPYSLSDFMALPTSTISEIVHKSGKPNVGVLIPDGTRKLGMLIYDLDYNSQEFERLLFDRINQDLMSVIKLFFDHGLDTFFVPALTNGNLKRKEKYVEMAINHGLRYILHSDEWMDFYKRNGIRVRIYGDIDLFNSIGYPHVLDWVADVQAETAGNDKHNLYYGLACSNREEHERILDYTIAFYNEHGRKPTRDEQVNWYYNGHVHDVDFFIRPTIFRDSDIQPPLVSGVKTQMYFPVAPFPMLNQNMVREIFFDILYNRTITYGTDNESLDDISPEDLKLLKKYYNENRSVVIGLGERLGDFWMPTSELKVPPKLKKTEK
jgi:hypothetical protein